MEMAARRAAALPEETDSLWREAEEVIEKVSLVGAVRYLPSPSLLGRLACGGYTLLYVCSPSWYVQLSLRRR